jgi:hypothetical protein
MKFERVWLREGLEPARFAPHREVFCAGSEAFEPNMNGFCRKVGVPQQQLLNPDSWLSVISRLSGDK